MFEGVFTSSIILSDYDSNHARLEKYTPLCRSIERTIREVVEKKERILGRSIMVSVKRNHIYVTFESEAKGKAYADPKAHHMYLACPIAQLGEESKVTNWTLCSLPKPHQSYLCKYSLSILSYIECHP